MEGRPTRAIDFERACLLSKIMSGRIPCDFYTNNNKWKEIYNKKLGYKCGTTKNCDSCFL